MAKSAKPAFRVDDRVGYYDRQDRWQIGVVRRIEAHWSSWSDDPLIIYSVSHPSYRNGNFYTSKIERKIP